MRISDFGLRNQFKCCGLRVSCYGFNGILSYSSATRNRNGFHLSMQLLKIDSAYLQYSSCLLVPGSLLPDQSRGQVSQG